MNMDQWIKLRRKIHTEEVSLRQLERDTGIHRKTLRKIRDHSQPPGYRRAVPVEKTKIGPYLGRIQAILKEDKAADHKKQYHTAKKIWEILQAEGFTGGIFQMGFSDSILQMWVAFLYELHHGKTPSKFAGCVTPDEVALSHKLFTAALKSEKDSDVVSL